MLSESSHALLDFLGTILRASLARTALRPISALPAIRFSRPSGNSYRLARSSVCSRTARFAESGGSSFTSAGNMRALQPDADGSDLDAFSTKHRRYGDLDAGVDSEMVWGVCDCGASMARRVDEANDARRA